MKRCSRSFLLVCIAGSLIMAAPPARAATAGHVVRVTKTSRWSTPSPDPSGTTYLPKEHRLLISDSGVDNTRVWKGRNLFLAGLKGHLRAALSLKKATRNPVGITYDSVTDHLFMVSSPQRFVVETTMTGVLVRTIDLSATGINRPSALVFARGSDGKPHHLYITDRGVNYSTDPNENDGRLFEFKLVKVP